MKEVGRVREGESTVNPSQRTEQEETSGLFLAGRLARLV